MQMSGQKSDVVRSLFCIANGCMETGGEEGGEEEEEVEGKEECTLTHRTMTQFVYAWPNR